MTRSCHLSITIMDAGGAAGELQPSTLRGPLSRSCAMGLDVATRQHDWSSGVSETLVKVMGAAKEGLASQYRDMLGSA
jgi:hypothetical protein